jgi:2-keto-4-pentenoate hydratase
MSDKSAVLAQRLREAYRDGPVAPLRDSLDPTDADGAYAVQAANTAYWTTAGRRVSGRKIGLTAEAVQTQLGVDQPDFGVLFADMQIADGGELLASSVLQPKAEAEIAFIMRSGVDGSDITREAVAAAVGEVAAAIEIVDSRIADLWSCGMVLEVNGEVASLGAGAACLGHPLNAATWLARTLASRGEPLRAGDVVLTGALGPMVTLNPGDLVKASVGGLGSVSFTYREDR